MLPTVELAPLKDWALVIGFVISCPMTIIGATLILNLCCDHWHRIRWRWLFRTAVWILMQLPREPDSLDWVAPPFVASSSRRRSGSFR